MVRVVSTSAPVASGAVVPVGVVVAVISVSSVRSCGGSVLRVGQGGQEAS
jgi:hypothetical protein